MDPRAHNTYQCMLVSGKQKKNPDKLWTGLLVKATVDGQAYSGIVFPARNSNIPTEKAIQF